MPSDIATFPGSLLASIKVALGKSKTVQTFPDYSFGFRWRMVLTHLCDLTIAVTPNDRRVEMLQEKLSKLL